MALNIEDQETESLAAQVASLTGESKAGAVRLALQEKLGRLKHGAGGTITPATRPLPRPAPPPHDTGISASAFVLEEREDDR